MPSIRGRLGAVLCAAIALAGGRGVAAEDEGEKVYQETCTTCHSAKSHPLDAVRKSRQEWKDAVERMEGNGADVPTGKKLEALLDYLERTHGPDAGAPAGKKQ